MNSRLAGKHAERDTSLPLPTQHCFKMFYLLQLKKRQPQLKIINETQQFEDGFNNFFFFFFFFFIVVLGSVRIAVCLW